MARYIDADTLIKKIYPMGMGDGMYVINAKAVKLAIDNTPTADVVPKSEYDAVVSAVDNSTKEFLKLHDDYQNSKAELAELKKDRYQVLPDGRIELLPRTDIDEIKSEVARAIFAEIENIAIANDYRSVKDFYTNHPLIAELKKKYIPKDCRTCKHMLSCEPNVFGICDEYEEEDKNGKENT